MTSSREGVILETANGPTVARNKVAISLGPPFGDYRVDPIVLKGSPPALSMGRMVSEHLGAPCTGAQIMAQA